MGKEAIGIRMKDDYEKRFQTHLMRRSYTVIRLDGKAFHTYTRRFKRPYDLELMSLMDETAVALCKQIQGAKLAYVQSDEITVVLTDFETRSTDAWFDGNVQKITSISASIATAAFNGLVLHNLANKALAGDKEAQIDLSAAEAYCLKPAYFDSRVFQLPTREEVINNLIWRQQDATRNSIQMGAQSMYSQKQLHGKDTSELQELMFQKGQNWNDYPVGFKRGRIILKEKEEQVRINNPKKPSEIPQFILRNSWGVFEPPIFSQEKSFLRSRIPKNELEAE